MINLAEESPHAFLALGSDGGLVLHESIVAIGERYTTARIIRRDDATGFYEELNPPLHVSEVKPPPYPWRAFAWVTVLAIVAFLALLAI